MSLKNKFFSILTVALGVVVFSTFTMAQDTTTAAPDAAKAEKRARGERGFGKHNSDRMGHHGGMMGGLHGLNLTDPQKEQVKSIMQANRPGADVMEEVRTLRTAKRDGTITADQQARLTALKTQAKEKGRSIHAQIQAILTPEQKAQMEQKKQEMKQRFEQRRQMHKDKGAPPVSDKPVIN